MLYQIQVNGGEIRGIHASEDATKDQVIREFVEDYNSTFPDDTQIIPEDCEIVSRWTIN